MHRGTCIQWLTDDDRGVQGVTGAYNGTQGLCTGAHRGCTGNESENTGVTGEDMGFSYGQGLLEPVVFVFSFQHFQRPAESKRERRRIRSAEVFACSAVTDTIHDALEGTFVRLRSCNND